ncbi:GGDEF domain-containing protein [Exiguobacterium alkaliphilum]|uniref:GGDEF domain-containing protein n=1 Tax=Exiguobacterium alkaliphilum TaxID=1428684 RepID=A0ABT2KX90_9BACL|nr:GGDEF domain-containing protein [Exiguobacterium alkaliphilum]MCT4795173.1 GGDEF domain-containing protein [Exiguobacterium alkaliphilum]
MNHFRKMSALGWGVWSLFLLLTVTLFATGVLNAPAIEPLPFILIALLVIIFQMDSIERKGVYFTFSESIVLIIFLFFDFETALFVNQIGLLVFQFVNLKPRVALRRFRFTYPWNAITSFLELAIPASVYLTLGGQTGLGFYTQDSFLPLAGLILAIIVNTVIQKYQVGWWFRVDVPVRDFLSIAFYTYIVSLVFILAASFFRETNLLVVSSIAAALTFFIKRLLIQKGRQDAFKSLIEQYDEAKEAVSLSQSEAQAIEVFLSQCERLNQYDAGFVEFALFDRSLYFDLKTRQPVERPRVFDLLETSHPLETSVEYEMRFEWDAPLSEEFHDDYHSFISVRSEEIEGIRTWLIMTGEHAYGYPLIIQREIVKLLKSFNRTISRCHERDRLYTESRTDSLTLLANARAFYEYGIQQISDGSMYPISVAMLDIDFFKKINDTHGHQVGDGVLQEFGRRIRQALRTEDFAARYGGEEFILLLNHCDTDQAVEIAERIRQKIEATPFRVDGIDIQVTASIGVDTIQAFGDQRLDDTIRNADRALYVGGKYAGRNRVAHFQYLTT